MKSRNPFVERVLRQGSIGHGRTSERRVAKQLGARLHPNSGASRGAKSDASVPATRFRLEAKSSTSSRLTLEMGWLAKIAQEALPHGQRPAVVVSFVTGEGKPRLPLYAEWVVLPLAVFQELTGVS